MKRLVTRFGNQIRQIRRARARGHIYTCILFVLRIVLMDLKYRTHEAIICLCVITVSIYCF